MTDDKNLVERLRAPAYWFSGSYAGHEGENGAPLEAADAIERLTRERDEARAALDREKARADAMEERCAVLAAVAAEIEGGPERGLTPPPQCGIYSHMDAGIAPVTTDGRARCRRYSKSSPAGIPKSSAASATA